VELIPKELWQNVVVLLKQEFCFFTPAGYGTEVAEGKEVREFNGKMHVMELAKADFAIVKLERRYGRKSNFKGTARNFNPEPLRSPLLKWRIS
jgi:acyl CoA:acetate/3-ketoacid CoA transferase alpha subunit